MENIFEQIDEELDADRLRKQWERNRPWIIGGFILFFLGLFAYVGWDEYRKREDIAASDLYLAATKPLEQGNWSETQKQLQPLLQQYKNHGYSLLGQIVEARSLAETGQKSAASAKMENLANLTQEDSLRDLALYNAALVVVDEDSPRAETLLGRIKDDSPFRSHALEILGLLALKQKDGQKAVSFFQKAIELGAKGELHTRLLRRLDRLGKPAKE
ncbi:MAG: tetratricopeptide repeat protein [Magnetococcales bacterium]|nr:tetratricopeptide repeat protein [Magnetococcales bacterium]MBF0419709.1 tetratricopeptide repeat protein [Magnetococcales bacterium]